MLSILAGLGGDTGDRDRASAVGNTTPDTPQYTHHPPCVQALVVYQV